MNKNTFLSISIIFLSLVILLNILAQSGCIFRQIIPTAWAAPPDDVKGPAKVAIKFFTINNKIYRIMANGQVYQYTGGGNFSLCTTNRHFTTENSLPELICNSSSGYYYTIGSDGYLYQSTLSSGGLWYRCSQRPVP